MPAGAASSSSTSLDEFDAQAPFFFTADDLYDCSQVETLEAVLRQPAVTAAPAARLEPAAAGEGGRGAGSSVSVVAPRRRPFRTDRHSKIRTAQGVRDRRMRLSVGVARDFFALQDKLGFDKASKTVDWLLTQSKQAIDRLSLADAAAPGDSDAFVLPPEPSASDAAALVKEKGEASSSSNSLCTLDDSREKAKAQAICTMQSPRWITCIAGDAHGRAQRPRQRPRRARLDRVGAIPGAGGDGDN
ncbi:hypothetical protein GUJ93_ZPchr0008g12954 [Zizania palustris]|uniref:TCP domain-containing protein n=1 Tax=Zizania palustris TaxID=103762 RepID=A0A8J5R6J2_ZIZPA|nr:hypothetical protein GUJ93_ZPchr0008g12954 [Zizania palustris]